MKAQKILNILLMILVILLISIISFVGIYTQKQANMTYLIPDYQLGINPNSLTMKYKRKEIGEKR